MKEELLLSAKDKDIPAFLMQGLKILLVSVVLALSSYVRIYTPFSPVPFTAQTLAVFLAVIILGKQALLSEFIWLGLGMAGLPVFAASHVWGPSLGYIGGFLLASWFLAKFLPLKVSFYYYLLLFLTANVLIYITGTLGLMFYLGLDAGRAAGVGVVPFLGEDIVKALAASAVACLLSRRRH